MPSNDGSSQLQDPASAVSEEPDNPSPEQAHSGEGADETASEVSSVSTFNFDDYKNHYFGTFFLKRRPVEYLLSCPSEEEFAASRPRALWKLAINATLRAIRGRRLSPKALASRRTTREKFIELTRKRDASGYSSIAQEWAELIQGIHPDDLHLWYCVSRFRSRRTLAQVYVSSLCVPVYTLIAQY